MQRRFFRQPETPAAEEQLHIAVTGTGRDAGATLIASSLAIFYAEKGNSVTYTECCVPDRLDGFLYEAAAMDQRFYGRTFRDFYSLALTGGRMRGLRNMERGVSWRIPMPQNRGLTEEECREIALKLTAGVRDEVCIFDVQAGFEGFPTGDMDALLVVVDPMPSRLVHHREEVTRLLQLADDPEGPAVLFLVNKVNAGVSRRQVSAYLGGRAAAWIPAIDLKEFYADEYHCRFHWENRVIREELEPLFTKLSHNLPIISQ